ncbi:MAG: nickel-type superoxide dismutase maturation protease [Chloroflexota bacterium]|nr:nickel-type superoxide dismutase maturation protease [Chloroflexota bacterium]
MRRLLAFAGLVGVALAAAVRLRRWIDVVEVEGRSMAPTLLPGDWLIVERRSYFRRRPRIGEIVLAGDPLLPSRELIKRVAGIGTAGLELRGDNPAASTDSATFGLFPEAAIRWRAIFRCWPPRGIRFV